MRWCGVVWCGVVWCGVVVWCCAVLWCAAVPLQATCKLVSPSSYVSFTSHSAGYCANRYCNTQKKHSSSTTAHQHTSTPEQQRGVTHSDTETWRPLVLGMCACACACACLMCCTCTMCVCPALTASCMGLYAAASLCASCARAPHAASHSSNSTRDRAPAKMACTTRIQNTCTTPAQREQDRSHAGLPALCVFCCV